eukprot:scaffold1766_cov401-Prasinococcus_capsulatus_cf.AAC.17
MLPASSPGLLPPPRLARPPSARARACAHQQRQRQRQRPCATSAHLALARAVAGPWPRIALAGAFGPVVHLGRCGRVAMGLRTTKTRPFAEPALPRGESGSAAESSQAARVGPGRTLNSSPGVGVPLGSRAGALTALFAAKSAPAEDRGGRGLREATRSPQTRAGSRRPLSSEGGGLSAL